MARFLITFALLSGFTNWAFVVSHFREPYCELLASSLARFFPLFGLDVKLDQATVSTSHGFAFAVIPGCDGLVLLCLFVAGVAAAPRQRALRPYLWAAAVLVLLVVINWLRLVILALTSFFHPDLFESVHLYVIQGILVIAVLLLFMAWIERLGGGGERLPIAE